MKKNEGGQDPFEGEVEEPKTDASADEIAKLKAENATLRQVQVQVMQPSAPVQAQPAMTQEELQKQAEDLGFTDPKQLESISKIAAHVAAPVYQKALSLERDLKTERAINAAKREAQAADPQFSKLESTVDEYLSDVPAEEKMDPAKLKVHMERATFYAKGKAGITSQTRRQAAPSLTPRGEDSEQEQGESMTGPETYETRNGKVSLTIEPKVSDKVRKMHRHPDIKDAIQIDPREEWKGPIFEKDLRKSE